MKKLKLRFEQDKTLDKIEIVVRAAEKDAQVTALLESLSKDEPVKLTVLDSGNRASVIDEKDIVFVASGGQGADEVVSESEAIKKYLLENGMRAVRSDAITEPFSLSAATIGLTFLMA